MAGVSDKSWEEMNHAELVENARHILGALATKVSHYPSHTIASLAEHPIFRDKCYEDIGIDEGMMRRLTSSFFIRSALFKLANLQSTLDASGDHKTVAVSGGGNTALAMIDDLKSAGLDIRCIEMKQFPILRGEDGCQAIRDFTAQVRRALDNVMPGFLQELFAFNISSDDVASQSKISEFLEGKLSQVRYRYGGILCHSEAQLLNQVEQQVDQIMAGQGHMVALQPPQFPEDYKGAFLAAFEARRGEPLSEQAQRLLRQDGFAACIEATPEVWMNRHMLEIQRKRGQLESRDPHPSFGTGSGPSGPKGPRL